MSGPRREGLLYINCYSETGSPCEYSLHVLVERDYEDEVTPLFLLLGSHSRVVEAIRPWADKYLELDDQFTLYLSGMKLYEPHEVAANWGDEITAMLAEGND
jgi:hypothetical protein